MDFSLLAFLIFLLFLFLIFIILFFFAFASRAEAACGLVLQQPQGGFWINQRWRG